MKIPSLTFFAFPQIPVRFPQINRKLTAPLISFSRTTIWLALYSIVLFNLFSGHLISHSLEQQIQHKLLQNPYSRSLHETLAQEYIPYNLAQALEEYKLAQISSPQTDRSSQTILGIQTGPLTVNEALAQSKIDYETRAQLYEKILQKDPNYQFASLQLAELYFYLDKKDEGKLLLTKLEKMIPYDSKVMDLKHLYGK